MPVSASAFSMPASIRQPARLAQFRCGDRPIACGRAAHDRLSRQRGLAESPLIPPRVLLQPNIAVPALLISIYGFGTTATSFVLPDFLTRVQGLRALQIGDALNWIALP